MLIPDLTLTQVAKSDNLYRGAPTIYKAAHYLATDLYRHYPGIQQHIWQAANLITTGNLFAPHPFDTAHVQARIRDMDNTYYPVTQSGSTYTCTCNSSAPTLNQTTLCRHVLAIKLSRHAHIQPHPLPPLSPKTLFPWLEETGHAFDVVGLFHKTFYPYPYLVNRPACSSEVVLANGRIHRTIHQGQRFTFHSITITPPIWLTAIPQNEAP